MDNEKTEKLLKNLLGEMYLQQSSNKVPKQGSFLEAGDGQFLGKITKNRYDRESILYSYGPFGSRYSPTSIWNRYSPYGSEYGAWSPRNRSCGSPPKLYINGRPLYSISDNQYIAGRVPFEAFVYSLKNHIDALLEGRVVKSEKEAHQASRDSFLLAHDDTFLGKLTVNKFDPQSIFNDYGAFGSKFSQTSIYNDFCPYGGQFSPLSPFNQFSQTPPSVYVHGEFVGYLTVNNSIPNRIDPAKLWDWVHHNVRR